MKTFYEAIGTTEDGVTITLEQPIPVRGRVQIHICAESPNQEPSAGREAILQLIHERQRARGHIPTPPEEVEAYIRELRQEDDEESLS
ncbi:MAG: hypothetical protein N2554_09875 [Fimbriimonadales bacterium]|nr:hypothetical protein [Fimbriimonadales bacterium]